MKKTSVLLLLATIFFGLLCYYLVYYADGGADGLSPFIPFIFAVVLFIAFLLAFLASLFLNTARSSKAKRIIIGIIVLLPFLGFLSVFGVLEYLSMESHDTNHTQVELNKTVLENTFFKDEDFGVKFQHVTGRVTEYHGEIPIPTLITPKIVDGKLIVPIDDESHLSPNKLLKIDVDPNLEMTLFFEDLTDNLQLESNEFRKASTSPFLKLDKVSEIWKVNLVAITSEDMSKLLFYFSPGKQDYPEFIYFIKSQKTPNKLWVLLVPNTYFSAPASVEKMTISNFENDNLWFNTLEIL